MIKNWKIAFYTLISFLFITNGITYALPTFTYSASAYNSTGQLLVSPSVIEVKITLTDGTDTYIEVFDGAKAVTMSAFGTFVVEVGTGNVVSGTLASIDMTLMTKIKAETSVVSTTPWYFASNPNVQTPVLNSIISNGSGGLTEVDLTADVTGILPIANGGTGASTAAAALINLLPEVINNRVLATDNTGNIIWGNVGSGGLEVDPKVGTLSNGKIPKWSTSSGTLVDATAGTDYLAPNTSITGATKTKLTYDAKGLVTAGADLSASDIPELSWSKITSGFPTSLSGYGITDAQALDADLTGLSNLNSTTTNNQLLSTDGTANGYKLLSAPATTGHILTYDGTNVVWAAPAAVSETDPVWLDSKTTTSTTITPAWTFSSKITANGNIELAGGSPLVFDGATADANKTTFAITNPTHPNTITFPNSSGTVAIASNLNDVTFHSIEVYGSIYNPQTFGDGVWPVSILDKDGLTVNNATIDIFKVDGSGNTTIAGTVSASNLSGTNTGDVTLEHRQMD